MISLLVQRAAVLMLRPAAMAAEALFVPGGNIMIFAIPIAALALTASSVPVHSQYMVATPNTPNLRALERSYVSGLLYISVISVAVLFLSLILIWKGVSLELVAITLSMFVIEKFSDELTRFYEFQKKYSRWFIAQSVRSIWLLVPVACYNLGADYLHSFFIASMSVAVITLVNFFFSTHLRPSLSPTGWQAIRTNAVFLSSSFLLAIHRQAPRIAVAFAFPKVAHFFQIVAQVGQVVSLLFNVKYVIPYRAVMSRRPRLFERMLSAAFLKIIQAVIAMLVLASLAIPVADLPLGHEIMMVALTVAMVADALAFSLMSTYWGYLPWLIPPRQAFVTCGLATLMLALFGGAGYVLLIVWHGPILLVPCLTILVSIAWVWMIRKRHFASGVRHVAV